jgi:hypothetical protein
MFGPNKYVGVLFFFIYFAAFWSKIKCCPGLYFIFNAIFSNSFQLILGMNCAFLFFKGFEVYNPETFDKFINSLEPIFKYEIDDLEMLGIGTASKGDNTTYFIVCNSDKLDAVRTRCELPKFDFHVTLGFNLKDVFSVRKNEVIK